MPLMVTRTKIGTMPVFLHGSSDCLLVFPRSIVWKTSHPISNSHACNRRHIVNKNSRSVKYIRLRWKGPSSIPFFRILFGRGINTIALLQ